jgi:hypothetical protein
MAYAPSNVFHNNWRSGSKWLLSLVKSEEQSKDTELVKEIVNNEDGEKEDIGLEYLNFLWYTIIEFINSKVKLESIWNGYFLDSSSLLI